MKSKEETLAALEILSLQKKEILKQSKRISAEQKKLHLEYMDLIEQTRIIKSQLNHLAKFKEGEKVLAKKAKNKGTTIRPDFYDCEAYVSKVLPIVHHDNSISFEYKLNAVKKDGTMSMKPLRFKMDFYQESQLAKI